LVADPNQILQEEEIFGIRVRYSSSYLRASILVAEFVDTKGAAK